jgi:hypothetical protein
VASRLDRQEIISWVMHGITKCGHCVLQQLECSVFLKPHWCLQLHGSFAAVEGGSVLDCLTDLTGGVATKTKLDQLVPSTGTGPGPAAAVAGVNYELCCNAVPQVHGGVSYSDLGLYFHAAGLWKQLVELLAEGAVIACKAKSVSASSGIAPQNSKGRMPDAMEQPELQRGYGGILLDSGDQYKAVMTITS